THTLDDVWDAISLGEIQVWTTEHTIIVTEVQQYPRLRAEHLFLGGGRMEGIEQLIPEIEAWAPSSGAQRIALAGRKGWERSFLAARGYAPQWSVMSREL